MSTLGESPLNSLFTSSISLDLFSLSDMSLFVPFLVPFMCSCVPSIFLSHFAFSPLLSHGRTPDATLDCVCMRLCICLLYFLFFIFFALKFNVSESLVKDERKVCGHACAYNKLKHLICPKEPRVSDDVFYPFSLALFSIALQMRLSLLIYLQAKGELTFL